jgi:tRNA-dihydrouridine synthase
MRQAAEVCAASNPDIIDINYGCPVKNVACKGAGAGILQDIPKMVKMTAEIVKAVDKPVTVKTRLGWDDNTKYIVEVAERLRMSEFRLFLFTVVHESRCIKVRPIGR